MQLPHPDLYSEPINVYSPEWYIVRAFPCLFPSGNGDFFQNRPVKLTHQEYFERLITYPGQRFVNTVMRHQAINQAQSGKANLGRLWTKSDAQWDFAHDKPYHQSFQKPLQKLLDMWVQSIFWK